MPPDSGFPAPQATRLSGIWTVHEWRSTVSTNNLGRTLPPGSIAKALTQTGGRGRMNRLWHSDEGGLWVSFVISLPTDKDCSALPLVAGLAILDTIATLGIPSGTQARLRWPNDLLIDKSKLAGILVERPQANKAVIGIGINICNNVAAVADKLQEPATRLCDLFTQAIPCPSIDIILDTLGQFIAQRVHIFLTEGLTPLLSELHSSWHIDTIPRLIAIDTCQGTQEGIFLGINNEGHPRIELPSGEKLTIDGAYITRLRELN